MKTGTTHHTAPYRRDFYTNKKKKTRKNQHISHSHRPQKNNSNRNETHTDVERGEKRQVKNSQQTAHRTIKQETHKKRLDRGERANQHGQDDPTHGHMEKKQTHDPDHGYVERKKHNEYDEYKTRTNKRIQKKHERENQTSRFNNKFTAGH